ELRMAIARLKNDPAVSPRKRLDLIVIATSREQVPPEAAEFRFILRDEAWAEESDIFVGQLIERLRESAPHYEMSREGEAQRLLEVREYRAAVIAAMTYLEAVLRERLDKRPWPDVRRPMSLRTLIERAAD